MKRIHSKTHPHRLLAVWTALGLAVSVCQAGDFDDGIEADTPVDDSLQTEINRSFIKSKVKGKIMSGNDDAVISTQDGVVGQGNIILGPGIDLPPGTIILNDSDNSGATAVGQ